VKTSFSSVLVDENSETTAALAAGLKPVQGIGRQGELDRPAGARSLSKR